MEQLHLFLDSTKKIKEDLNKLGEKTPEISEDLFKSIEKEISPDYIIREKSSNLKTILMIQTTIAAFSSTLLPYPFSKWISWFVLLMGVPVLLYLLKYSLSGSSIRRDVIIRETTFWSLIIGSILLAIIGMILLIIWIADRSSIGNAPLILGLSILLLATLGADFAIYIKTKKGYIIIKIFENIIQPKKA